MGRQKRREPILIENIEIINTESMVTYLLKNKKNLQLQVFFV
jgi:hypothetical protein